MVTTGVMVLAVSHEITRLLDRGYGEIAVQFKTFIGGNNVAILTVPVVEEQAFALYKHYVNNPICNRVEYEQGYIHVQINMGRP